MPGLGHEAYLQIGREATYGTAVAATRRFNIINADMRGERGKVRSDAITDTVNRKDIFNGPQIGRLSLSLEADYEGQLHLWDAAMGTATYGSNGGTSSGAGPYTWTFIQRMLANSLSCQLITNIPSTKCDRMLGGKVQSLKLSGSAGMESKPLKLDLELVGTKVETNQTPTAALTANSALPIMFHHMDTANFKAGTADSAGADRLRAFEFSIKNNLNESRYYGADTIDEPLRDLFCETQLKFTIEFTSRTAIDEYLTASATTGAPVIKFAAPTGTKSLQISMPKGVIVTPIGRPVDRYGVLTQEFTCEAVHDTSSGTGVTVTVINSESTIS